MWASAFLEEDAVFQKAIQKEESGGTLQYAFSNTGQGWFETHLGCSESDFIDKLHKMQNEHEEMKEDIDLIIADVRSLKALEVQATIGALPWARDKEHIIKSLGVNDGDLRNLRRFGSSREVSLRQSCNLWEGADNALKMLDEFQDVWGEEEKAAWTQAMQSKSDAKSMWKSTLHQIDRLTQKERGTLTKAAEILESEGALSSRRLQERMIDDSSFLHKSMTPSKLSKLLSMYGEEMDIIAGVGKGTFVKMDDYGIIIKDVWEYAAGFLDEDGHITITERGEPRAGFMGTGIRGKSHCEQLHKSLGCGSLQLNQKSSENGNIQHRLLFYSEEDVRKLLEGMSPHLKIKGEQAKAVLSFLDTDDVEKRERLKRAVRYENEKGEV
jgi:sorbitol-specific phosphotransferase system component IIA